MRADLERRVRNLGGDPADDSAWWTAVSKLAINYARAFYDQYSAPGKTYAEIFKTETTSELLQLVRGSQIAVLAPSLCIDLASPPPPRVGPLGDVF